MVKVLDVSGELPKKKKKKVVKDVPEKKVAKKKKVTEQEAPIKKKKRKKQRVGDLLRADPEQAVARIEQHAALAGVVIPADIVTVENPEAVFLLTYQKIFRRLRRFSRKMEREMSRGDKIQSRDVYALNVLYNQTREVMADMRSLIDMSVMAETLCTESLDPLARTSAQAVTTMLMTVQSVLREHAPQQIEVVMDELKKAGGDIGTDLNNQLMLSRTRLTSLMTQSR